MTARSFFSGVILSLGIASVGAWSEARAEGNGAPVVVELFTSQGCSSCPPADGLLHELAARDDVIALALHVDYWDYIGWKDAFALPDHTRRQKSYARVAGRRMIYTPQMIINGTDHVVGNYPMDVNELVAQHLTRSRPVKLDVSRKGDGFTIRAQASGDLEGAVRVMVVRYNPEATVQITRGENAGRTISYANIVREWQDLGLWDGDGAFEAEVMAPNEGRAVILLQLQDFGSVLAASELR